MKRYLGPLLLALILGSCGLLGSERIGGPTGELVFQVSTGVMGLAGSGLALLMLRQLLRDRRVLEEDLMGALEECRLIYEGIRGFWERGKPTGKLYKKSWRIAKGIVPHVLNLLKKYPNFLRRNPELGRVIRSFKSLWEHYHGGKRVEGVGPCKEMGKALVYLQDELCSVLRTYGVME
jgi:hypothetical protein